MNAIEIKNLNKSYPGFDLRNLNLTLPSGCIMGLVGENGAGKSTTIKLILGMGRADSGEITVLGQKMSVGVKQDIGVVLDEAGYPLAMNARQIGKVMRSAYKNWNPDAYEHYLEKLAVPANKPFKDFSRGMKMKLSLAAALAHRPRLLILDEATAGLDPVVRDEILDEFLGFIGDEEHSILLSSHIITDLEKVADYITYLHQGQVVLSGSKDAILDSYGKVGCTAAQLEQIAPGGLLRVRKGPFGCEGLTADREAFRRSYPGLTVDPASLEDIMLLIGKGEPV